MQQPSLLDKARIRDLSARLEKPSWRKKSPGRCRSSRLPIITSSRSPIRCARCCCAFAESDLDDPVARAEKALAGLSGEFKNWMTIEADRLSAAHAAILKDGFTVDNREELFRAAHDIKGDAATFGYPSAGAAAESLCRIIEHAPDLDQVPAELIAHHINAIQAIVRERTKLDTAVVASELSKQLRGVADEFLLHGQPRPPRASRSDPGAEHRSGGVGPGSFVRRPCERRDPYAAASR